MSSPFSKLPFTQSSRTASGILAVSLVAIGVAVYLSPSSGPVRSIDAVRPTVKAETNTDSATTAPTTSARTSTSPSTTPTTTKPAPSPGSGGPTTIYQPMERSNTTRVIVVKKPGTVTTRTAAPSTKVVVKSADGRTVTVHVPAKAALVTPRVKYYGLAEDGLPGSASLYDSLDRTAGKAPNLVEWFEYWDDSFASQKVVQAWSRDALPVITWQSVPHDYANSARDISGYSLSSIASGAFDKYLRTFAAGIAETGLPVGIRLDQEMNGNWYPWSAGYDTRGIHNTPARFVAAWRHVWQVFQDAGANKYVIWAWTPSRTDTLVPDSKSGYSVGDTGLREDYPGDGYVDWTGLSAYQFRPAQPATYDFIFGGTLEGNKADVGLKQVSDKPIFIAEMGSAQTVGVATDNSAVKAAWTTESLARFARDPAIVGFTLFNNDVDGVHEVHLADGTNAKVRTNWKFDSSPEALAAFRAGVARSAYGSGLMPQPDGVTVKLARP